MGVCASAKQKLTNDDIDSEIQKDSMQKELKLLLLGPGECGKSTFLKQMRIIHDKGFSAEELMQKRAVLYANTVQSMASLLGAMRERGIELENPGCEEDANQVIAQAGNESIQEMDYATYLALSKLWKDKAVLDCYKERSQFQVLDSAKYFLDSLDRIHMSDYKPTNQDVLLTRVATMGVAEVEFEINNTLVKVFDVGGQKSERRKWINCFDDVDAVIFVVAVSAYDQTLREDQTENRMMDSIALYEHICNLEAFKETSMVLFLNKIDIFKEKIQNKPLTKCFETYKGPQTYYAAMDFIRRKFEAANRNPEKKVYIHETCVTDTEQIQAVLKKVLNVIIEEKGKKS